MKQFISHSDKETREFAKKLAKNVRGVIGLTGELGVGKTTFAQGFAEGLKIKDKIISPTFILIRQYQIPKNKKILFHIDLYRLNNLSNIDHIGLREIIENPRSIVLIEWAEKVKKILPKNTIWIKIKQLKDNKRRIIMKKVQVSS